MSHRWSEQFASRYRLRLPADLAAWFDEGLWEREAGGEFHCPLPPEKLIDPPPGLIWTGFLPPDMLPLISNDYGDLLCLRVGRGNAVREIVAWRHGGGDWIPYGASLAEALLYDAAIGSPYSQQEQFVDRDQIDPVERDTFARWAYQWLAPTADDWPADRSPEAWIAALGESDIACDAISRDICLRSLHTPLRESRGISVARELEIRWSPEFVSWQFDGSQTPESIRPILAAKLDTSPGTLLAQEWDAAAAEALRVVERRGDLGWAWDLLGWNAERQGDIPAAIAAYRRGLQTSQFADQAIDFRTHWFDDGFAKFSAWRLYELRDQLSPAQRGDDYLRIFHASDAAMLRRRIGRYWIDAAERAANANDPRAAYRCFRNAGWDVGLHQLSDYELVLTGMIHAATKANDLARAEVARAHLAAM